MIFVRISSNSRASMVLFRQWFHWWISICCAMCIHAGGSTLSIPSLRWLSEVRSVYSDVFLAGLSFCIPVFVFSFISLTLVLVFISSFRILSFLVVFNSHLSTHLWAGAIFFSRCSTKGHTPWLIIYLYPISFIRSMLVRYYLSRNLCIYQTLSISATVYTLVVNHSPTIGFILPASLHMLHNYVVSAGFGRLRLHESHELTSRPPRQTAANTFNSYDP